MRNICAVQVPIPEIDISCPISGDPDTPAYIPAPIMRLVPSIDETIVKDVSESGVQCKPVMVDNESMCEVSVTSRSTSLRPSEGSYGRDDKDKRITYSWLLQNILISKDHTIDWLFEQGLLVKERICPLCNDKMKLCSVDKKKTSDERIWRCQKKGQNPHNITLSIRHGSWFSQANLTLEELLQQAYL